MISGTGFFSKNKSHSKANLPTLAAITGNTLWGFSFLLSKTALRYAPTYVLLSIRFLIAFFLMNLMLVLRIEHISLKGKKKLPLILLALNEVVYFYCESYGIAYTNSTFTGVVLSLVPILAMAFSAIFLKEIPTFRQTFFSFFPVIGVIIITLSGSASGVIRPVGILFVFATCILSAIYRVINRRASVDFTAFERTYFTLLSSSFFFTADALRAFHGNGAKLVSYLAIPGFILPVLLLSLFCSVFCYILVNYAAGNMSVGKLVAFSNLQTMWSMFAGVLFLKEPFGWSSLIGSVLILYGVWEVTKQC